MTAILKTCNLTQTIQMGGTTLQILQGITLQINRGETVAIVGASGAGKSTLLGLLAGLDLPDEGDVYLDGIHLNELDEDARAGVRAEKVGFVFQSFQLLPSLTAIENVMLPLELNGQSAIQERAQKLLAKLGLADRLNHYPQQLSGGEQQRVALARAFVSHPEILFADEPTGNLDQVTGDQVIELLFSLNKESGTTLILVTHEMGLAERCDRVLKLQEGRLLSEWTNK